MTKKTYEISTHHDSDDRITFCDVGHWTSDNWVTLCEGVPPVAAKRLVAHLNNGNSLKTFAWAE